MSADPRPGAPRNPVGSGSKRRVAEPQAHGVARMTRPAPLTINTMPEVTLRAFAVHGQRAALVTVGSHRPLSKLSNGSVRPSLCWPEGNSRHREKARPQSLLDSVV